MNLAARETTDYGLPAERERGFEVNTAVFTCDILNTNVLFSKLGRATVDPSEGGSFF
jgi:hypothetical protein